MKKKFAPQSSFFNLRVLISLFVFLAGVVLALFGPGIVSSPSALAQGANSSQKNGASHKLSVRDRQFAESLRDRGARLVADYGSFVLLEANDALTNSVAGNPQAEIADYNNLILLNAKTIDTSTPEAQSMRDTGDKSGNQMRLIQFKGPIRPEWHRALVSTGVRVVTYIPNNAYLVYGGAATLRGVQQLAASNPAVQWEGEYTAAYRLDPAITGAKKTAIQNLSEKGNEMFTIQLVEDPAENAATLSLIDQLKLEPIMQKENVLGYVNVKVALPREAVINQIAQRGDVVSIQPWVTPIKVDERQDIIMTGNITGNPAVPVPMDYFAYLTDKGFALDTVADFAVNVSDSGIDNATQTPNHFGLYRVGDSTNPSNSRIIYNRLVGTPNPGSTIQGCDGHGTLNSHIVGGYVPTGTVNGVNFDAFPHADALLFRWGRGLAPFAKIGSSVIFDPHVFTFPNFEDLESMAYNDGARISSNSWGTPVFGAYDSDSQRYDALVRDAQNGTPGNQEYTIVFAAGNQGPGGSSVISPGTAKNVITVGAAENVNPFGGPDTLCGIDDSGADNANDIIFFSSRGPCSDDRKKPEIVAPGTHVSGGLFQASIVNPPGSGNGQHGPCFDGSGVCGGPNPSIYWPLGQEWYTASSGTSHSCPGVAGTAALIRQHFINQSLTLPNPAMIKALIMNSARYMTGVGANDTLWSNSQGMGEISLNDYFDIFATAHMLRDQVPADLFTASGQQRTFTGAVSDSGKPFRVTLAWTEPPGPTSGNAFVNDLDLEVDVGGNTYKGNVFSGAFSTTGGVADIRDNAESVFIPAGVSGTFVIRVTATNIAGDGVPDNGSPLDQDFALVAYNAAPVPIVSFVIGDLSAVVGQHVTFWGAQWARSNALSGGPAPSAFKGYADNTTPDPPSCGGTWTTHPGNSSNPPSTLPSIIRVIVASSITRSGSVISGNVPQMAIISVDPGYQPDPGHAGTGTVLSVSCQ
jgi:subtilisin family serine protease